MHAIKQQSAFNLCYNLEEMIMQQVFHKGDSKRMFVSETDEYNKLNGSCYLSSGPQKASLVRRYVPLRDQQHVCSPLPAVVYRTSLIRDTRLNLFT